jgi:thymidylate synthase
MQHQNVANLRSGYTNIGRNLMRNGTTVWNARTKSNIRELMGYSFTLEDPYDAAPTDVGRGFVPAIAAVEALQLVGGWSDPELTIAVAPNMAQFTEDDGTFHGAYGPRLREQIPRVIDRLERDLTTRQAMLVIFDPLKDWYDGPKDLPCTITMQLLVRDGALHGFTYMRSNDFWWGLAYDAFQFTRLQITIAQHLGLDVGKYHHHVGSFHAYERDWDAIKALKYPLRSPRYGPADSLSHSSDTGWRDVQDRTRKLATGYTDLLTPRTGQWFAKAIRERLERA